MAQEKQRWSSHKETFDPQGMTLELLLFLYCQPSICWTFKLPSPSLGWDVAKESQPGQNKVARSCLP